MNPGPLCLLCDNEILEWEARFAFSNAPDRLFHADCVEEEGTQAAMEALGPEYRVSEVEE